MSYVEIENLWVMYGRTPAVRDLSFAIPKGEVFGFLGPNGAGKTTTIRVLATLLKPAFGTARIGGADILLGTARIRKRIGFMPDTFGTYEDLTVLEYLDFFGAAYDLDFRKRRSVIADVLALADLAAKRNEQVNALSRGMRQRLALARVLLHDPDLLLLDEPASGLDPRARIEIREMLKELKGMGKTILISSHILHELSHLCTRIGIIEAGRLVAEGSLDDICRELQVTREVHVRLANRSKKMLERIEKIEGVSSVDPQPDRLSIRISEEAMSAEDLLEALRARGARIQMFQPETTDMETIFMRLTKGKTA